MILALLSYSLAATLSLGRPCRGATAPAQTAEMQLQGGAENDEGSVAPDADEDTTAACVLRDCPSMKEEPTLVLAEVPQSHEEQGIRGARRADPTEVEGLTGRGRACAVEL